MAKTCGVYCIRNKLNGDGYIGSTGRGMRRKHNHWSDARRGCHDSIHLQRAWNKYGGDAFEFIWLEELADDATAAELEACEQIYIDRHVAGSTGLARYNVRKLASSNLGIPRQPESRAKMSVSQRKRFAGTQGYMTWDKSRDKWQTIVQVEGKRLLCRRFDTEEQAAAAIEEVRAAYYEGRKPVLPRQRRGANRNSKSGTRGVTYVQKRQAWRARAWHDGRSHFLGEFKDRVGAEEALAVFRAANPSQRS